MPRKNRRFPLLLFTFSLVLGAFVLASLAATGSAAVDRGAPGSVSLPTWRPDIRVDPTEFPTPYRSVQRNFSMSANPANPQQLLTGYDNQRDSYIRSAYGVSTDGGRTWTTGAFTSNWIADRLPVGDVNVAYDRRGVGYYSGFAQGLQESGYYMLTSTNGLNWSTPVPIVESTSQTFRYRVRFTIDNSPTSPYVDRISAFWNVSTIAPPYFLGLKAAYSTDGGRTWSGTSDVSDPQWNYSTGTSIANANDGTLYAAWLHIEDNDIRRPHTLLIDRSNDGGVTWGTDRVITGAPMTPIGGLDFKGREYVLVADDKCSIMRIFNFPFIGVSPTNSNEVYAVWNDGRWESSEFICGDQRKHSDIAFSRSTDGGVTWSPIRRLNDDAQANGVDQFQPTLTVREDGLIGVTWLDRRYSTESPYFYDVAYTQSTDGGLTWSPNQRVSDVSNDPNPVVDYKSVDDLGYRNSLVFAGNLVIPSWIKTIRGTFNGDYNIDRGVIAETSATRTPTSVPSRTATAVATATACTLQFSDVDEQNPFYANIRCLSCRGIIGGYADGTFRPGNNITRGQIAKMVSNAAGFSEPVGGQTFEDVTPDSTFYEWIERLSGRGVMGGYSCGGDNEPCVPPTDRPYFRPGNNATRGQLSKIVSNAAGYQEPHTAQFYADVTGDNPFYPEIMRLTTRGAMSGYPCGGEGEPCDAQNRPYFRWGNPVTRGQASKIVANTFYPNCQTP
jgi:hypothetical protein